MSFLTYHFRSYVLQCATKITITYPDLLIRQKGKTSEELYPPEGIKYPTIYLLHGGGGESMDWLRYTQVDKLSTEKGFMSVSIDAMESFYSDMAFGRKYFTYLTEELPVLVQRLFHSSAAREDNFIIGFSMGAHGAMKAALRRPELYAAVWAMSGAKDPVKMAKLAEERGIVASDDNITMAFGGIDKVYGSENDLLHLAQVLKGSGKEAPMIYTSCGTEDYGYDLCVEYKEHLDRLGLKNEFFSVEGIHDYFYANRMLIKAVRKILPILNPLA
jgi:S-formylglutathione hydrolase FrmB